MSSGKPTVADVARQAGVSPSTASRVIHNNGYVSEDNRERVLQAVKDTGYRPNIQARSLRNQRSYTLGLVLSSASQNPFFAKVSNAIRTAAGGRGYSLLTVNHGYKQHLEVEGIKQFLEHDVEAVFLCHALDVGNLKPLVEAKIPLIQIERVSLPNSHLLEIDPVPGMRAAIHRLVALGHRRIGFLGGSPPAMRRFVGIDGSIEMLRQEAFIDCLKEVDLQLDDCPIVLGDYSLPSDSGNLSGHLLTQQFIKDGKPIVTAIVTGSDILAAGALQALYEFGLRVPDDISVVGYDDSLSNFLAPPLTAIAQPYAQIGEVALDLLEEMRKAGEGQQCVKSVSTFLVERASVGPAR